MLQIDPDPFTLRELVWMSNGFQQDRWIHTTQMICAIANANRSSKDKAVKFEDVYPFPEVLKKAKPSRSKPAKGEMEVAKQMFLAAVAWQGNTYDDQH